MQRKSRLDVFSVLLLASIVISMPGVAHADDLADAKAFIKGQVEAIKAGDLPKVKASLSSRIRNKVTAEGLDKAKSAGFTATDDLWQVVSSQGKRVLKLKNGKTLTTLIEEEGIWVANTIWWK